MGNCFIDALACDPKDIAEAILTVAGNKDLRAKMKENGLKKGKEWLAGVSDVNGLLKDMSKVQPALKASQIMKKDEILFMQHSSAGDVLMTTKCFKGLKERHSGKNLVYMTQKKFHNIVECNPLIDRVVDWDVEKSKQYIKVYNPHSDRILPGSWGRNANTLLSDFYWKILDVEPDQMFIKQTKPDVQIYGKDIGEYFYSIAGNKKIVLVHTTGGTKKYRTYKYMDNVCDRIREEMNGFITIQVGSHDDCDAKADIDLRGALSFQESAWVVSRASYAITVDSFVSHLTEALGIPQLCLFGTGNSSVVRPEQSKNMIICLSPDYIRDCPGLGPCSGVVDCDTPCCTNMHSPKLVYNVFKELTEGGTQSIVKFYSTIKKGLAYEVTSNSR